MTPGAIRLAAQERQAACNSLFTKELRESLFVTQAVLRGQEPRVRPDEGGQEVGEMVVCSGLEADEDELGHGHVGGGSVDLGGIEVEVTGRGLDRKSLSLNGFVVAAKEEVDVLALAGEQAAVEAAQRAGADDGDGHGSCIFCIHRWLSIEGAAGWGKSGGGARRARGQEALATRRKR